MPVLEIERFYQTKEEIAEYRKVIEESENLRFIGTCLWDFNIQRILGKEKGLRKLEAIKRAFGLLEDLTSEEWQQFREASRRRPLFDKR